MSEPATIPTPSPTPAWKPGPDGKLHGYAAKRRCGEHVVVMAAPTVESLGELWLQCFCVCLNVNSVQPVAIEPEGVR
jgi:hypothetical protein